MPDADLMPVTVFPRGSALPAGLCDRTVVWLRGEHDISTSVWVAQSLALAIDLHDADLVVDLREATFIDAVIIGVIVGAKVKLARQSRVLLLRAPTPAIWRLLVLCGLSSLVIGAAAEPGAGTNSAGPLHSWTQECLHEPNDPLLPSRAPSVGECRSARCKGVGHDQGENVRARESSAPDTHRRSIMSRSTMTAKQVSFF